MNIWNQGYWQDRYEAQQTGWDTGEITTPIKEYIDQLSDRSLRILIPGAGNAYEAEYLFEQEFEHVTVLDIALGALDGLKERVPDFPHSNLIHEDFFSHSGTYDLILEQTFFCAIDPKLRMDYVRKCHDLLASGGKIVGLLWDDPMNSDHPPFGGSQSAYRQLFGDLFDIDILAPAYNSIKPRLGREVFIKMIKKD